MTAAPREPGWRLKSHRLEITPVGGIAVQFDAVLVSKNEAGGVEDISDGRVDLSGDLGLRAPDQSIAGLKPA